MDFPIIPGEAKPEYLGDGVYATHDGYHVWLRTRRDGRWEAIALEPMVMAKLWRYTADLDRVFSSERILSNE